jgi:hypothetical protein
MIRHVLVAGINGGVSFAGPNYGGFQVVTHYNGWDSAKVLEHPRKTDIRDKVLLTETQR